MPEIDVLVTGAGPAGAAAALVAARAGLRVLIRDRRGRRPRPIERGVPRPAHDIMVSDVAVGRLAELGIDTAGYPRTGEFELRFPTCTRSVTDSGAAILDADALRESLIEAAMRAGAEFVTEPPDEAVRHVVTATGASAPDGVVCAGRFAGIDIKGQILMAPVTPVADPRSRPAMLTILPGDDGAATAWLARLDGSVTGNPDEMLADALAALARSDGRVRHAYPLGPAAAGPLPASFSPGRLMLSRELIVGDAAGLVNPFTGEGLGAALLSGTLAAEAIVRHPADTDAARADYAQRLSAEYVGYFETAQHAARRYHLVWRMLEGAAGSDHIFLTRARRAVLLPESTGKVSDQLVPVEGQDRVITGPFLFACDEMQIATLRVQWPFLARLLVDGSGFSRHRLRSGLLFLAGLLAEDRKPDLAHATAAAAIELAIFGTLAFLGSEGEGHATARSVDWAAATLVLAGDFLLSQGSRLIAESAPELSWAFADWLAELSELRASRLRDGPATAAALQASLMEFPARAGALLGCCADETVQTLRGIGHALGEAFGYAEDVLALSGQRTRLDATLATMVATRTSTIPDLTATPPDQVADRLADRGYTAIALAAARTACSDALQRARTAITAVPGPTARRILLAYAAAIEPGGRLPRDSATGAPRQRPFLASSGPGLCAVHARSGGDDVEIPTAPTGPDRRAGCDVDSGHIRGAAAAGSSRCRDSRARPA